MGPTLHDGARRPAPPKRTAPGFPYGRRVAEAAAWAADRAQEAPLDALGPRALDRLARKAAVLFSVQAGDVLDAMAKDDEA